jgi:hypothetical protein
MSTDQFGNNSTPWLSEAEISDLCAGLKQKKAQARFLGKLGLPVHSKPNGCPLVFRRDFETLMAPLQPQKTVKREPNRLALIQLRGAK